MALELTPITLKEANRYVDRHHRRLRAPQGALFAVACAVEGEIVGVAIVGRPTSRLIDPAWTVEVSRVATDGTRNACSFLLGAARRAAFALGYKRVITYTLDEEGGASLRASGYRVVGESSGGSWSRKSRPRVDRHPQQRKFRWEG